MAKEHEPFLQFGGLGHAPANRPLRVFKWAFFILVAFAVTYIASRILAAPETVMTEERAVVAAQYGFAVKQSRFGAISGPYGTIIRFWGQDRNGYFEDTYLNRPRLSLANIEQHEWLAKNEAVLLALNLYENYSSY